jgi:hypothetical protein
MSQDLNPGLDASKPQSPFPILCVVFSFLVTKVGYLQVSDPMFKIWKLQGL